MSDVMRAHEEWVAPSNIVASRRGEGEWTAQPTRHIGAEADLDIDTLLSFLHVIFFKLFN